ncbi:MAG: hypothetical protein HY237_12705 [Acidobacteria bacterium]|nr:hypothetical protein [Acidobacteriota bacterium]
MWKHDRVALALCGGLYGILLLGLMPAGLTPLEAEQTPKPGLPSGPMKERADKACLACHDVAIIVQEQLERRVWTKEVDKMIRWGAPVAPEDRDTLIDYFAQHFAPREDSAEATLPDSPGVDKVRVACLACHGADYIVGNQLNRQSWTRLVDKMVSWGAEVSAKDREAIIDYLVMHSSPPAKDAKKKEKQE